MKSLSQLNSYFFRYKWHFLLGIAFVILSNYFRLLSPQITGYIVNSVIQLIQKKADASVFIQHQHSNFLLNNIDSYFKNYTYSNKILFAGLLLIVLAILSGFFMFLMRQSIIVMSRHIEFDQKNDIYNKYQQLDIGFYKSHATGDLMNRISEDVSRVRMYTGPALMYFINLAAVIGFSVYFMWQSDSTLTIYTLIPLPFLAITIYFVNAIINKKSEKIQEYLSHLTSNAQESFSGIRVIKSFFQEKAMISFFEKNSEAYRKASLSLAQTESIYFPSMGLLIGLSTIITIAVGCLNVVNGVEGASVGKIAEFVLYIQLLTFPVSAIGWTASMTQRAAVSQKRINDFLCIEPAILNPADAIQHQAKGDFECINADFTYQNTGIHALKNISFKINKGNRIAIIGKTGSGKSTLAQIMLRIYDLNEGDFLVDNHSIKKINLSSLRHSISYVPQDNFLFSDTIKNNIQFGNPNASEVDIIQSAKNACVHEDILSFSKGYDTVIGERGIMLSGGQKQRICIARALIKNPEVLILDDSLNAVDTKTAAQIAENLNEILKNKTIIFITHRLLTSLQYNNIILLNSGKITETGTHEELMINKGPYFELQLLNKNPDID
jgi:ATP-binding cassette subfamily B protein